MTEATQNINIDAKTLQMCLKSISNFGETIHRNICTGQEYAIPWGGVDWTLAVFLIALGVGAVVFVLVFAFVILRD